MLFAWVFRSVTTNPNKNTGLQIAVFAARRVMKLRIENAPNVKVQIMASLLDRWELKAAILVLGALFSGASLLGQDSSGWDPFNPDPFGIQSSSASPSDVDSLWEATTEPVWEKQMRTWPQLPEWPTAAQQIAVSGNAMVSADELRHPLSGKGRKLMQRIVETVRQGNHKKAIQQLLEAVNEPTARPYAYGILGLEYLRMNQPFEAIPDLQQAIALMPKFAASHSNLGYALCLTGQPQMGLQELDIALSLDSTLSHAHFLKGAILLDEGSHDAEAWDNLQVAQRAVPTAHLALALYYARHGQDAAADQQLKDYADLNLGVKLAQARKWLREVADSPSPALALGLLPSYASK
ncbi:MAG TPA: hypothetical protein VGN17_10565 [Bryobacteraceae bacterium]